MKLKLKGIRNIQIILPKIHFFYFTDSKKKLLGCLKMSKIRFWVYSIWSDEENIFLNKNRSMIDIFLLEKSYSFEWIKSDDIFRTRLQFSLTITT